MTRIAKIQVANGVYFVEIPDAQVYILCGCPADSVKHLMKRGLILTKEENGITYETGPNVVLLSDVLVQNGSFANLAEFPVLQMLYKQGMILPNHPNNTGVKPMLIGLAEQVDAQMQYIYRGNYGLVSCDEIESAGIAPEAAKEMMRLKLRFAFGKINSADMLLDTRKIGSESVEIRNGVFIQRIRLNVFEIMYDDQSVVVDLNLMPDESYGVPYTLGFHQIKREYFAVIHSGDGDGWNVNHPCMSSILMFQGKIYLIDAGPNVLYSLMALGIGVNEIEGIFHTHAHDDHFAGFTTLMRSDHRIKYYATPLVRASVTKKLSELMSIEENNLYDYFEIHDLDFDKWNDIDGLEVKPVFSPHPVETSILFFKTLWENGYKIYAHLADIVALSVLKKMITGNDSETGISQEYFDRVRKEYFTKVQIKKIDVGGGLIHGDAEDFKEDQSDKIILSHTSADLTNKQKEIGSGAPFGMVDVLIPTSQNYLQSFGFDFLRSYFPTVPDYQLKILANNSIITFNPESILLKRGVINDLIYLVLTGNVELIQSDLGVHNTLSAGALIGEISGLDRTPSIGTYRALNFVQALQFPGSLYYEFVNRNKLFGNIKRLQAYREFLQKTWLFGEVVSYPTQVKLAQAISVYNFPAGHVFAKGILSSIYLIRKGRMEKFAGEDVVEMLNPGSFFGEECILFGTTSMFTIRASEDTQIFEISGSVLLGIPVVRWKLFETFQKRMRFILKQELDELPPFDWEDEYSAVLHKLGEQHKMISEKARHLTQIVESKAKISGIESELNLLIRSVEFHINYEEMLIRKHKFDNREHLKQHKRLLKELRNLLRHLKNDDFDINSFCDLFKEMDLVKSCQLPE